MPQISNGDAVGFGDSVDVNRTRATSGGGGGSDSTGTTLQPPGVLQLASTAIANGAHPTRRGNMFDLRKRLVRERCGGVLCAAMFAFPVGLPSAQPGLPGRIAFDEPHGPLLPGARFPLRPTGVAQPRISLVGPGRLDGTVYVAPATVAAPETATVVAATHDAVGSVTIALAPWPRGDLFAVATYEDGVALHRASDGELVGLLPLDGGVDDVAQNGSTIVAPSSAGPLLWSIDLSDGTARSIAGVPTGNEVAAYRGDTFVTNRDVGGDGALTRVHGGAVDRIVTGDTAEGLAIDASRGVGYVTNVNSRDVAAVDLATLRLRNRYVVGERPFGIALDPTNGRIDVVSNVPRSPAHAGGLVLSVDGASGAIVARSAHLRFPIGVALDPMRHRLFVSDEADGTIAVLNPRTLRPLRAPLRACAIPWRPTVDAGRGRLYVPCAGSNAIAAFDLATLAPLKGSPYPTGGYPLGVATLQR